jgi:antitoxin ParD1/3/4
MNVSIGKRWEGFVDAILKDGRYGSASEVVREGLRLVEEREARLLALRKTLAEAIGAGGSQTDDEIGQAVEKALAERDAAIAAR